MSDRPDTTTTRPPAGDPDHVVHPREVPPERLKALTDGTVAIVLTLMVLELRLPEGVNARDVTAVRGALVALIPVLIAYYAAFLTVANLWLSHATMLQGIRVLSRRTAWATLSHLFFLCLIPFPMYLNNQAGWTDPVAVMIFIVVIGMASTTLGLARISLLDEMAAAPELMRTQRLRVVVSATLYLVAFLLAATVSHSAPVAIFIAVLAPFSYRLLGRRVGLKGSRGRRGWGRKRR